MINLTVASILQYKCVSVVLPGKSHGQRTLVGYSPWGCKESDTTEQLHFTSHYHTIHLKLIHVICQLSFLLISFILAGLGLCCCERAFSSCGERGLLSRGGFSLKGLLAVEAWALWCPGSVAVAPGLSCPVASGIFPVQGSNLCLLLRQIHC